MSRAARIRACHAAPFFPGEALRVRRRRVWKEIGFGAGRGARDVTIPSHGRVDPRGARGD